MRALTHYVEAHNSWNTLFGAAPITLPLDATGKAKVRDLLESDLSPENLTCDGELRGRQLQERVKYLRAVEAELEVA